MTYKEIYGEKKVHLITAGIIGAGKSTLTKKLSEYLGYSAFYEPVNNNPYLHDFYKDMKTHGFAMQIELLHQRVKTHLECVHTDVKGVIQDRSIYEDVIFAKMLHEAGFIDKRNFGTYVDAFESMRPFLMIPDLILYLDVTPETAYKRLKERARESEKEVPIEYLRSLETGYKDWLDSELPVSCPKFRLDYNEIIPVETVVQKVNEYMEKNNCQKRLVR